MFLMPGIILVPLFLIAGGFWAFGPGWSWIPFNAIFWTFALVTLAANPSHLVMATPMSANSSSATFSFTLLLSIAISAAVFVRGRNWELIPSGAVFVVSAYMWRRLRS